jgi:hypothetical protein
VISKPAALGVLAVVLTATFAAAQAPVPKPATPAQVTTTVQPTTTLTGCLYREDQVPGRKPNVAERAGVLEDYILADTTVADAKQQPRPAGAPATGTSGTQPSTGTMYKVENIPDEKLKALVGKRVEVAGRIDPEGRGALGVGGGVKPDRGLGPDAISLPEFEASSIREVSGKCPATPPLPK